MRRIELRTGKFNPCWRARRSARHCGVSKARERELLFQHQAHAFSHLVDGSLRHPVALCPLCLVAFGAGDVHGCAEHKPGVVIEHAPPRQRTRLGRSRQACLTHVSCQGSVRYESDAGRYRSDLARLRRGQEARIRGTIDGEDAFVTLRRDVDGVRPVRVPPNARVVGVPLTLPVAAQLTELKAAYLIAFSVLGYSWATSPALDAVRATIQSGDVDTFGAIPLFRASDPRPELANCVLVAENADHVAVIGDDPQWGVLLPLRQQSNAGEAGPSMSVDGYVVPWLPDGWWRQPMASPFRWDCGVTEPRWRIELDNDV